jgi:hypothetical protein
MDTPKSSKDHHSLQGWYRYAAKQSWAVDAYLRLVRIHEFKTQEQQRNEFGATPEEFLRLQAMHLPRKDSFALDARRIAQSRHLQNPNIFVQKLLLAQQLAQHSQSSVDPDHYYQAAFDTVEDLDTPGEPEKE